MVEMIGLATMSALVWLLAWSMATESDEEKRRETGARRNERIVGAEQNGQQARHAA